jgi:hypothetical protein
MFPPSESEQSTLVRADPNTVTARHRGARGGLYSRPENWTVSFVRGALAMLVVVVPAALSSSILIGAAAFVVGTPMAAVLIHWLTARLSKRSTPQPHRP